MRIGAIFARGSCRALKWTALFGVVFALGAGQAAAQIKVNIPETVDEGGRLTIKVDADIRVPAEGAADTLVVTATATARAAAATTPGIVDASKKLTVADTGDFPAEGVSVTLNTPRNTSTTDHLEDTVSGTITLQMQSDSDSEDEGIVVTITFTPPGTTTVQNKGGATLGFKAGDDTENVTMTDTDEQMFVWGDVGPAKPNEGANITVSLKAEPEPFQLTYATNLLVDTGGYSVMPATYTFTADDATTAAVDESMSEFTITPPNPDGDRDMDTIMVNAYVAGESTARVTPLEIEVADIHGLPMADDISAMAFMSDEDGKKTKDEAMSIMEGAEHPVHVTVTADRGTTGYPSGEKLKVTVMGAAGQGRDYRVEPTVIEIDSGTGEKSKDFKLWALEDEDIGAEDLMLTLEVMGDDDKKGSGKVMKPFSIMIEDATEPWVSVKDDAYDAIKKVLEDPLNSGDEVMIMTDDLFMYDDDMYNVSFGASVDGAAVSASSSGEAVTITAMEPGESKVTVTATATPVSSSLVITQDRANVAQLTFPVMVELADLMVELMGPEDMNVVEGMSYEIKAMANRAVAEDTMVELFQTDGTASPSDYTVGSITIMAGEEMGSTMLMVAEDEMMENMNNMPEMLTLEGRVGAMKTTNALTFYLWDAAVPALPIIAQLLLAAFLAIGGYRRYLRR